MDTEEYTVLHFKNRAVRRRKGALSVFCKKEVGVEMVGVGGGLALQGWMCGPLGPHAVLKSHCTGRQYCILNQRDTWSYLFLTLSLHQDIVCLICSSIHASVS